MGTTGEPDASPCPRPTGPTLARQEDGQPGGATHFKGNHPDSASIQASDLRRFGNGPTDAQLPDSMFRKDLLPPRKPGPDAGHGYRDALVELGPVTHVRFNIFPDGGVSRPRRFGTTMP